MSAVNFSVYLNSLRQKGNLKYEYNPFYNYLTNIDLYLVDNKYVVPYGQAVNIKNGELLVHKDSKWVDKRGRIISNGDYLTWLDNSELWALKGSIIDFDTDKLHFDLSHPVEIEILPSYDGSVNLILNDDKNIPRLINSRFSVREKNTYEIVDRIGENDTNIYNSETFDKDTSLYFLYEYNPIISYEGFIKGTLPVGQYCFYFTYCDSDGNESDFIAETGLIPLFIGNDGDPFSMDGGIKNLSSNKGVKLKLTNIDKSYNYLKVYFVRYFADYNLNRVLECKKIYLKYSINSNIIYLQITGYEEAEDMDANLLNILRFNPKSVLTLALCKNMLFFGNIVKNADDYKELSDLALRIVPELNVVNNFDILNERYKTVEGDGAYYNSLNIYNKTGYFNLEYYRFGVVFIYLNGTLSNVYNTLGGILDLDNSLNLEASIYNNINLNDIFLSRNYILTDDYGWVKPNGTNYTLNGYNTNSRGVCKISYQEEYDDSTIFSIKFKVPKEISKYLKEELGIRGLFFVRQKCIPNIIALCYLLKMDSILEAPVLELDTEGTKKYYTECFLGKDRLLTNNYSNRLYKYTVPKVSLSKKSFAGICPDFLLNLPYYNQIFNGGKFKLLKISSENSGLTKSDRFYNLSNSVKYKIPNGFKKVTISSITEDVSTVALEDKIYRSVIGQTEESYRFKYAEIDNSLSSSGVDISPIINAATNLVRGKYSPYLAIYSNSGDLETGCLYNIYLDVLLNSELEFKNRMNSSEPFYAISDRYNLFENDLDYICWRGDCFINQFTYRLNRNFNDPSLPNNDTIIDTYSWFLNYDVSDLSKLNNISRSDVNAILLGSWITFKVRSAMNYALRSVDHSYVSEEALMGSPRSFYPRSQLLYLGENKLPDSYLYNDAYRASLGFKCYFALQDINYIKNTFSNRILYSAISILDSFKNNYRYSLSTYFRDYSQEYGSIQKLLETNGNILVIFEHGIGLAPINERVLVGGGEGDSVFINSKNVLPEELVVISDTYGTLWGESVVKSEIGNIYGVDTVAKKIWRIKNNLLELISDFKVNKFLIENISFKEEEVYPIIGLKNVKTHYNNNKKDIIFTFYDDIYKDEEKVWSLCYNELLDLFITFYSWIPSYSENIDNLFFTFDRNTAKYLALLNKCNYSIPENTGVLVDNPIVKESLNTLVVATLKYSTLNKNIVTILNLDGTTSLKNTECLGDLNLLSNVKFKLEKDHWQNYKLFEITNNNELKILKLESESDDNEAINRIINEFNNKKVILLQVTPYLEEVEEENSTSIINLYSETIALTLDTILNNPLLDANNSVGLTTDFYLHGKAGIFNVKENLYPTYWYGEQHPFEFEFVVNDKIGLLKIFSELVLISNKAEPESFHFEIEGDNYEFSLDKRNMYFRQEATKNLYLNLGSNITYDRKYPDVASSKYQQEQYYRPKNFENFKNYDYKNMDRVYPIYTEGGGLVLQIKSTIFPLYYQRVDTYNDIYDHYIQMKGPNYDFKNLSGSEIKWDRDLNQFNIVTHIKNNPIDLVGKMRGNSRYKESKWSILIPSILFMLKNEDPWPLINNSELNEEDGPLKERSNIQVPPIVINSLYVPKDLDNNIILGKNLPNIYTGKMNSPKDEVDPIKYIDTKSWTFRKETRIRDKWIKIRVRYSGKNLAVIFSLITLYNISYS